MPVLFFKTKDEVPAELHEDLAEVTEDGDKKGFFQINVASKKKLDTFRDNNISANRAKDELDAKLKALALAAGIDVEKFDPTKAAEEFAAMRDTVRRVNDGKLKGSDEIDKEIEKRMSSQRERYETNAQEMQNKVNDRTKALEDMTAKYMRTFVDRAVTRAIGDPALGIEPTAIPDIIERAYRVFEVTSDFSIIPKVNGQTLYSEIDSQIMTMPEWLNTKLRKEAPHYYKRSSGGGATGGKDAGGAGGMTQETFAAMTTAQKFAYANAKTTAAASK
jgi:hypothetical protein